MWQLVPRVTEKWPLSVLTGVRFVLSELILAKIHERFVEKNGTVRYVRVCQGTQREYSLKPLKQSTLNIARLKVL